MLKLASAYLERLLFVQHFRALEREGPEPSVVQALVQTLVQTPELRAEPRTGALERNRAPPLITGGPPPDAASPTPVCPSACTQ